MNPKHITFNPEPLNHTMRVTPALNKLVVTSVAKMRRLNALCKSGFIQKLSSGFLPCAEPILGVLG
jgi:hypothetical protein